MHLIKNCPSCGRKLRFPLEKGTIRVKCRCGQSFIANPDDPALYKGASFDLTRGPDRWGGLAERFGRWRREMEDGDLPGRVVGFLLQIKYDMQNFRLLPSARRRRLMFMALAVLLALALISYLLLRPGPQPLPDDGMTV